MNYLLSHVHVEIWDVSVYVCHNNSATSASAFINYILSYLKSQPISQAHFKEGRNKRRLQAGSRVELERTKTLFGFLEMSDVIFGLAKDYQHTQMHKPGPALYTGGILQDMEWIA